MKAVVVLVVAAAALTGCASGSLRARSTATAPAADTVEALRTRVVELQQQAAVHEVEMARLRQAVEALEARLGGAPPRPAASAPPPRPVSSDDGTGPIERGAPIAGEDLPPAVPLPPVPTGARAGAEAQALYDQAYAAYQERRYADAEALFTRFLGTHGSTDLGDNAQYWIGESRFARADYAGALTAFRETADRFPEGNKLADALLKSADCLAALGNVPAARLAYQEVIRRFPGSSSATSAEERQGKLP
ncbi:MAG: tol-pal system protein YbgF [Thermoanaerobaculia bacterium]|nr:tol-pal system protein YbgF [Thermoanaerobaculia bacterium]